MDFSKADFTDENGKPIVKPNFVEHENKLMDDIVRGHNTTLLQLLKSSHFDAGIVFSLPYESFVPKKLRIPAIRWTTYLPDPSLTVLGRDAWFIAEALPLAADNQYLLWKYGHAGFYARLVNQLWALSVNYMVWHLCWP